MFQNMNIKLTKDKLLSSLLLTITFFISACNTNTQNLRQTSQPLPNIILVITDDQGIW